MVGCVMRWGEVGLNGVERVSASLAKPADIFSTSPKISYPENSAHFQKKTPPENQGCFCHNHDCDVYRNFNRLTFVSSLFVIIL